jgi:hypothetical protein
MLFQQVKTDADLEGRSGTQMLNFFLGHYFTRRSLPSTIWQNTTGHMTPGTFGNANSPVQRLHLLEVSFVLYETMAQSNSALFSRIKWISGVNVAQSLKEGKERG